MPNGVFVFAAIFGRSDRARRRELPIRVYDEAGNVIETHEHKGVSKSGEFCLRETKAATRLSVTADREMLPCLAGVAFRDC
jgi:hypothetical protein